MTVEQTSCETSQMMAIKEIKVTQGQKSARFDIFFHDYPKAFLKLTKCQDSVAEECVSEIE